MQAYARYFLRKYFVRSRCELTVALLAKEALNLAKVYNKNVLGRTCPQNRLKPKWFKKALNSKRFSNAGIAGEKKF